MTAQLGQNLLLKIKYNNIFHTVAGVRTREMEFNLTPIDITDSESAGRWQELLSGGGVRHVRISGQGIFRDDMADDYIRTNFFSGQSEEWHIILPDFGTVSGLFMLTELAYAGKYDGELSWRLELVSAGEVSFVKM